MRDDLTRIASSLTVGLDHKKGNVSLLGRGAVLKHVAHEAGRKHLARAAVAVALDQAAYDLRACDHATYEIFNAFAPGAYSSREFIKEMGKWLMENGKKENSLVKLAYEHDVPIFCPAFVADCLETLEEIGATYVPATPGWGEIVKNLETVPVVALALGPTAGLGAARVVASHYSIMVKGLSQIFAAGPAVVDALGEACVLAFTYSHGHGNPIADRNTDSHCD